MWKKMVVDYYNAKGLNQSHTWNYGPNKWDTGHMFDEPQKFILFGDPSVITGGAFNRYLSGNVYNHNGGPLSGYSRYRITGDVTVPNGQMLSADSTVSILFENGKKITALDASQGLYLRPGSYMSVCLMAMPNDPTSKHVVNGIMIKGRLRLRSDGAIKFY